MRVLDAGCGGGDTAAVLLELVGSEGSVVGIDTIPEAVTASQMRFPREQYPNMQFRLLDANRLPFRREFDAVVGRFMLMYAPEPVETAAKLAECLRPGGVITFIEPDYTCVRQREHLPLYRRVQNLIDIALQRIGADTGIGLNLYRILRMAGLSDLEVR